MDQSGSQQDNCMDNLLLNAAGSGDKINVEILLAKGANVNYRYNGPFLMAAAGGHMEVVALLVEWGTPLDAKRQDDRMALHFAAEGGHIEVVTWLVERGAPLDAKTKGKMTGKLTPLYLAAKHGHIEVATLLVDRGASLDVTGKDGITALHWTVKNGHLEIATLLVEGGASLDDADVERGRTGLHTAAVAGHLEMATLLVEGGASLDAKTKYGCTALHEAAEAGHVEVATLLLDRGASLDVTDNNGRTALHLAEAEGHLKVVTLLVEGGACLDVQPQGNGWTVLHQTVSKAARVCVVDIAALLVLWGAPLDVTDKGGWTPLSLVLSGGAPPSRLSSFLQHAMAARGLVVPDEDVLERVGRQNGNRAAMAARRRDLQGGRGREY